MSEGYLTAARTGEAEYVDKKSRFFSRVRSVADEDGNVLQQNLYYAWGGAWGDVCTAPGFQSYKYCGKYLDQSGVASYDL